MFSPLVPGERLVFIGDSVTDADRDWGDAIGLGTGYVRDIAAALVGVEVYNRGVSGDRIADLVARFDRDCLALRPDAVSVMIGVNDTWSRLTGAVHSTPAEYESHLARMAEALHRQRIRTVLMEPFVVAQDDAQWGWRADLDARIAAVRRVAQDFDCLLVATDGAMAQGACDPDEARRAVTIDGVHPTPLGHQVLADAWLAVVPH
jgi:lysophospholipase L1-like esterase